MRLRPYQPSDMSALYEICLRTTRGGEDGTATCTHPDLVGSVFAVPYAVFDSGLTLILDDGDGPCGYVLGTADTRGYNAWFNRIWLPRIRSKFSGLKPKEDASDGWVLEMLGRDSESPAFVDDYPAHLHIDLLPRAQGTGWGRRMINGWVDLVKARGVTGFHLGVSAANQRAVGFYRHVGLEEITAEDWGFHMGMKLGG